MSIKRDVHRELRAEKRALRRAQRAVLFRRMRCFWLSWPPMRHVYDPSYCVGCHKPKYETGHMPPRDATRV
jgi:hypothetical protein